MTPQLHTNRDLYLAIDALSQQYAADHRSLESYLLAILQGSAAFNERDALTLTEFFDLIKSGFTEAPAIFDEAWRTQYSLLPSDDTYAGWRATIIRQIVDLHEMDERGTLNNDMRYFGLKAPRQSYWYNFEPAGYLECAMAGSLGGWEPGDDTGRNYVPGQVAVLADDGSVQSVNPKDLAHPVLALPSLTWAQLKDFCWCGQQYE